jgi:dolichol-phosphate mannosyltransferase
LGTAVLDAFRCAIENGYAYVITMDGDFSHSPRYLPDVLAGMNRCDVMIGSRYVPGGGIVGWNWLRKFMSGGINLYTRWLLGVRARDCSGGFRAYRVSMLERLDFREVRSRGYSFMEEILYRCQGVGGVIGETPIVFENRKLGKSKINPQEAVKALWILGALALGRWIPAKSASGAAADSAASTRRSN